MSAPVLSLRDSQLTQARCRRLCRPSLSVISAAFMAFYRTSAPDSHIFPSRDTYGKVLLVGEDEEHGVAKLILVEHALELFSCFDNAISVVGVNNEDDALSVLEVMSPQWSNLVLPTNIPHGELDVLVLDRLNVEAWVASVGGKETRKRGASNRSLGSWCCQSQFNGFSPFGIAVTRTQFHRA